MSDDYDPAEDARRSYEAAVEAKRQRGDTHWPQRASDSPTRSPIRREVVIGDCRLLLGDCLEILPTLGKVDAVVTDPPYGIGHRRGSARDRGKGVTLGSGGIRNDERPFDPAFLLQWPAVIWGANHFASRLPRGRWIVWDKTLGAGSGDFSEFEVGWCSRLGADRFIRHMWMGVQRESEVGEKRLHDTQKPIVVMEKSIEFVPDANTILDPFMGSGTTGVACIKLGRRFIGIEIDERYFDVACERIAKAHAQPDMLVEAARAPEPVQASLLGEEGA